jgi:hypothetical protein
MGFNNVGFQIQLQLEFLVALIAFQHFRILVGDFQMHGQTFDHLFANRTFFQLADWFMRLDQIFVPSPQVTSIGTSVAEIPSTVRTHCRFTVPVNLVVVKCLPIDETFIAFNASERIYLQMLTVVMFFDVFECFAPEITVAAFVAVFEISGPPFFAFVVVITDEAVVFERIFPFLVRLSYRVPFQYVVRHEDR